MTLLTRHRASTSMHSLTFRVRVTTPRSMDEMELPRCMCVDFNAGEGSLRRHAVGLADYRWALPRISSVAIATQPVHRLQIRPIVHN